MKWKNMLTYWPKLQLIIIKPIIKNKLRLVGWVEKFKNKVKIIEWELMKSTKFLCLALMKKNYVLDNGIDALDFGY